MPPVLRRLLAALAFALASPALADQSGLYAPGGVALDGYDPVAYFHGAAARGSAEHALKWRGAVWHFVSAETMTSFEMNPKGYAPRFGGYCAWGVAEGRRTSPDPEVFLIHEGRLYLLSSPAARGRLEGDMAAALAHADSNWPAVLDR